MKLKELAIDHDYYSSDNNYYSNEASSEWATWTDFYNEFHDADIDMNLIFRWDVHKKDEGGKFYMEVFMIHQQKGIYHPIRILHVEDKDVKTIIPFMQKHWDKLNSIWKPLS